MKYLITLGCSWTWGAGVGYTDNLTPGEYKSIVFDRELADKNSFRSILSERHGYRNINFSIWKSSNKKQFRQARQFFSSDTFTKIKNNADDIIVLWGITSTGRDQVFSTAKNEYLNLVLNDPRPQSDEEEKISNFLLEHTYDHDHEVFELAQDMTHWNHYFKLLGVRNYWFDSFNHHDYTTNSPGTGKEYINNTCIENFAVDHDHSRDLMSQLAINSGIENFDSKYHSSAWEHDTNRIDFLVEKGLINPYSYHPTKQGHMLISNLMNHLFK